MRGITPLGWAARMNAASTAVLLLQRGASAASCDTQGNSAVAIATERGSSAVQAAIEQHLADETAAVAKAMPAPTETPEETSVTLDTPDVVPFLASLNIADDYEDLLDKEGINTPGDFLLYTIDELIEAGFKRAHARKIMATVQRHNTS
eukprot:m.184284 g.184284  ORF g.184284 m.184284 type:complete len:149 (+) comp10002_c0_seq6:1575-2021(+)